MCWLPPSMAGRESRPLHDATITDGSLQHFLEFTRRRDARSLAHRRRLSVL